MLFVNREIDYGSNYLFDEYYNKLSTVGIYLLIINVGSMQLSAPVNRGIKIINSVVSPGDVPNNAKKEEIGRDIHSSISKKLEVCSNLDFKRCFESIFQKSSFKISVLS